MDFLIYKVKVTDIYIYDDLCYNIPNISKQCKQNNIDIRLILNTIPSTAPDAGDNLISPIFTPRDKDILNEYIDTIEFDCYIDEDRTQYNWNVFNVLYEVWFKDKDWYGDLRSLNKDLNFYLPVYSTLPTFSEKRISCGRRCAMANSCHRCKDIIEMAQELANNGYFIRPIYSAKGKIE